MDWANHKHPGDTLVEWAAPVVLAAASGWAVWTLTGATISGAVAALGALGAGLAAMRWLGGPAGAQVHPALEAIPFDAICDSDELLLDDPLEAIESDSRVVRLFAKSEPTPGELVLRISDFLVEAGRPAPVVAEVGSDASDASAALHAALANIRASLR